MAQDRQPIGPAKSSVPRAIWILLRSAWQRKLLVALCLAVALALAALIDSQRRPIYKSSAQVLILNQQADGPLLPRTNARLPHSDDSLAAHQLLIRSPLIIQRAVQKRQLQELKSFAQEGDPTGVILAGLSVGQATPEPATLGILQLAFRGPDPDDCASALNAIIDSYQDFLDEIDRKANNNGTHQLLIQERDKLEAELKGKHEAHLQLRRECPPLWKANGANPHLPRLTEIEVKRSSLRYRRIEIEGQLKAIEAAKKQGRTPAELLAVIQELSSKADALPSHRSARAVLQEQLLQLQLQEKDLLDIYGDEHPAVIAICKRIERTRKLIANPAALSASSGDSTGPPGNARSEEMVLSYVRSLRDELELLSSSEKDLAHLFEEEVRQARDFDAFEAKDEKLRAEITRIDRRYEAVLDRLREVKITGDAAVHTVQIILPPGRGVKVEPNPLPLFLVAILLGLLGGLGLGYLAEQMDRGLRTAEEIGFRLQLPVVGHVPLLPLPGTPLAAGAVLDPTLYAYYQPESPEADDLRALCAALCAAADRQKHKVIQITSPCAGDGKSLVAANLAVAMAQSSKRIILIDANLRGPRLHTLFRLSAHVGLTSVIGLEVEPSEAIQQSAVPGLWVLPSGPRPPNPIELFTSPDFTDLLEALRDRYDFVLIDTPAVLDVTDARAVAPLTDEVLLTIRVSRDGRPQAERAKHILASLGVKVTGVIANGLRLRSTRRQSANPHERSACNSGQACPDETATATAGSSAQATQNFKESSQPVGEGNMQNATGPAEHPHVGVTISSRSL